MVAWLDLHCQHSDDDNSTIATEYDSLEPATILEENELSTFIIPTISASVAQDGASLQVPPPGILSHSGNLNHHSSYQHYHHLHHLHYHYPRHMHYTRLPHPPLSSSSSSYTLLPVLEPPVMVSESIELHATDSSELLPPEIVTTIPVEESSS